MKLSSGSVILGVLSFILACNGQSQKTVSTVNVDEEIVQLKKQLEGFTELFVRTPR